MRAFFWAVLIGLATQTPRVGESALLYGWAECLAMTGGQQLNEGDQLLILAPGVLTDARTGPIRTPSAGTDCWNRYQEEQPARVSSLPLTKVLGGAPFFAFRREDGFLVVGGAAVRMGPAETERWLREVSSSPAENWRAPTRLVHAYQYTSNEALPQTVEHVAQGAESGAV